LNSKIEITFVLKRIVLLDHDKLIPTPNSRFEEALPLLLNREMLHSLDLFFISILK